MGGGGSAADVRVSLLGGFAASVDDEPVDESWRLRKAKTLVKLLALAPGHRMHRDAVLEMLWPDADPGAATNNLHQTVHAARRALGPTRIALRDDVLHLCPDDALTVDVDAFEQSAAEARASRDVDHLRAALANWTGPLLPEDEYESWAIGHRERLRETHAALTSLLAQRLVEAGDPSAALAVLDPLVPDRPTDEPMHRVLIAALAALGRRWDAIAAYERLRDGLEKEYAAEPEPPSKALYRRLLTGSAPLATTTPHNLPEPATSFVGRQRELGELALSLERTRLLTLTGPGGAGKSRLSLELARRAAATAEFPDGVWRVQLAGVKDDEAVTSTAASALRLSLPGGVPSTFAVADQLATRRLLLVLDNCEHLLAASGELVAEVLARCPDVIVVTTSREPLGLAAEVVYRVPSLEVPADHAGLDVGKLARLEAVQLFVERAQHTAPRFELQRETADAVARICHQLDGMPLALELAAARLAHLSVSDLADGLSDALTLLARRGPGHLDRQQTLAATLDWSHDLLEPDEQVAFRRLAVFAGGFDLEAAAHVCADAGLAVDLVSRLVDKSLVDADTSGPSARYRLLQVVRQYADVRLTEADEAAATRRRHHEWYATAAAAHDPDRGVAIVGEPSPWFDDEQDNLRAALSSALADDPTLALQLATTTWRFWLTRGLIAEGARWLTLALDRCDDRSSMRARALAATYLLQVRQGRAPGLTAIGDEIVALLSEQDDSAELAHGRHQQTLVTFMSGDWDRADELSDAALREAAPYPGVSASAQNLAGIISLSRGDIAGARQWFDRALASLAEVADEAPPFFITLTLAWMVDDRADPPLPIGEDSMLVGRRVGARQAWGHVLIGIALTERLSGRIDAALALIDAARSGFDALADRYGQGYAAAQRGHTLRWAGDLAAAERCLLESEALRRELRDQRSVAMALSGQAIVAASAGDGEAARTHGREAMLMMERSGDVPGVALTSINLAVMEVLLGDAAAALVWADRGLAIQVPGGQRSLYWTHLLRSHLLRSLGDPDAAAAAALVAQDTFTALGEQRGLAALQRACKAGVLSVLGDNFS